MLHTIEEVNRRVASGEVLLLAGSEDALSQVGRGNWIGGTIPYFMDHAGAICSETKIFVNELPKSATLDLICEYTQSTLHRICNDAPENGISFLILPASSPVHIAYAKDAPEYENIFMRPVCGWVAGVHLSELGKRPARVFNGLTGESSSERAMVLHAALPASKLAVLDIINVFHPGSGDVITFPRTGFTVSECEVNGERRSFAEYIGSKHHDPQIPLTADYNGSIVNVSIQAVNQGAGIVSLYAPVFPGIEYRFGLPVPDYLEAFTAAIKQSKQAPAFSCNCILNYLYAGLEGKKTANLIGPITFGEIAHQLLNQTAVRLFIHDIS